MFQGFSFFTSLVIQVSDKTPLNGNPFNLLKLSFSPIHSSHLQVIVFLSGDKQVWSPLFINGKFLWYLFINGIPGNSLLTYQTGRKFQSTFSLEMVCDRNY